MKVIAVIPSGGIGKRTSHSLPKQYIHVNGKEIIAYTLEKFQRCSVIDQIVVSAKKEFFSLIKGIKEKYGITKLLDPVEGGNERQYSVFNAVKSLSAKDDDIILIHDAVRPLVSEEIIKSSVKYAKESGGAVVAIKAKDTLMKGKDSVNSYIDRSEIYYVQTPQVFRYNIFVEAIKKAEQANLLGTDESMLVFEAGYKVKIVPGSSFNFKITSDEDILLFENLIKGLNQ
ncbi:MAG: 2-C-methyl-D-erythritol 4-phosphate cytidylyltransferase [Ignavibacteria bacterium]|nr:2-C-methyl-D-erythritol 4-phosphate cytidylyltransferase [Ignavibacteria bacterium]